MEISGSIIEFDQWKADNERLVLAALRNGNLETLDPDEMTLQAVKKRCVDRFGEVTGSLYYFGLITTFPERHKEIFPEIFEASK